MTQKESSDQSTLLMSAWHPPYERYSSMGANTFLRPGALQIWGQQAVTDAVAQHTYVLGG